MTYVVPCWNTAPEEQPQPGRRARASSAERSGPGRCVAARRRRPPRPRAAVRVAAGGRHSLRRGRGGEGGGAATPGARPSGAAAPAADARTTVAPARSCSRALPPPRRAAHRSRVLDRPATTMAVGLSPPPRSGDGRARAGGSARVAARALRVGRPVGGPGGRPPPRATDPARLGAPVARTAAGTSPRRTGPPTPGGGGRSVPPAMPPERGEEATAPQRRDGRGRVAADEAAEAGEGEPRPSPQTRSRDGRRGRRHPRRSSS